MRDFARSRLNAYPGEFALGLLVLVWSGCSSSYVQISPDEVRAQTYRKTPSTAPSFNIPADPGSGKLRVAVVPVQMGVENLDPVIGRGIHSQLVSALTGVENYVVIDRAMSDEIAQELKLSQSSLVPNESKIGGVALEVADLLIQCTVVDFAEAEGTKQEVEVELETLGHIIALSEDPKTAQLGTALAIAAPDFTRGEEIHVSKVSLSLRAIDVRTGGVVATADPTASFAVKKKSARNAALGYSSISQGYRKSTFADASRVAIEDGVRQMHKDMSAVGRRAK